MNYHELILSELNERKRSNPSYSLRAFARDLELSPGFLSSLINGQKKPTLKSAKELIKKLALSQRDAKLFIASISGIEYKPSETEQRQLISDDEFKLISEWYHLAILSLTKVKGAKSTPDWFAKRLGINVSLVKEGLQRLERLNFLVNENGRWKQIGRGIRTSTDVPSEAIRHYHRQNLDMAKMKLNITPVDRRDFSSITFAGDSDKLKIAKELIRELRAKISDLMETKNATEVYTLAVQLFPVSERIEE